MHLHDFIGTVSLNSACKVRQSKKCGYRLPALLDIVFEQAFSRDNLPNMLIVLKEPALAFIFIVIVKVAEMVPD